MVGLRKTAAIIRADEQIVVSGPIFLMHGVTATAVCKSWNLLAARQFCACTDCPVLLNRVYGHDMPFWTA
jgi:hypothetical protein